MSFFSKLTKAATAAATEAVSKLDLDGDHGTRDAPAAAAAAPASADLSFDDDDKAVQLSTCDGNHRALYIGINYFGTQAELKGCINDVHNIQAFMSERYGFTRENSVVLTDDNQDPAFQPTRANIEKYFQWLVAGAAAGDSLFLHYSGHGGTATDENGDEADSHDETIIPVDFQRAGQILDDDIHRLLVKPLPQGVRLTAIFDSCHSGSVMDLPFTYNIDGNLVITEVDNRKLALEAAMAAGMAYMKGDQNAFKAKGMKAAMHLKDHFMGAKPNPEAAKRALKEKYSDADVIQFSGCRDEQTSADANIGGQATGAMSHAFVEAFRQHPDQTFTQLLGNIRQIMHGKFSQIPQMSSGHKMDMNVKYIM